MRTLYHIRTVQGMPVRLHYTLILGAVLGFLALDRALLPHFLPGAPLLARFGLAALILTGCALAVVVHELGHVIVARWFHVSIPVLHLYPLGALTRQPDPHAGKWATFAVAAAGPLASLGL